MKLFPLLQPVEDMGLRDNTVREGAAGIRGDPGRVSEFGTHEIC